MIQCSIAKKEKINFLQNKINEGDIFVGERLLIGDISITCVHIDFLYYYFSIDDIFVFSAYDNILNTLKEICDTGKINNIEIIPNDILQDIDYMFVPTVSQVSDRYGKPNETFDLYKRGDIERIKGFNSKLKNNHCNYEDGETVNWWLSKESCIAYAISYYGIILESVKETEHNGIPYFFRMTRKTKEV